MRVMLFPVVFALAACSSPPAPTVREIGEVPNPPNAGGRDVGFSALFGGHSVWVFGDTFFADASADGYHWRASTWSFTDDMDASDGLDGWTHALGADEKPLQLLPHTAEEQAFNDAHNGDPCPAGEGCGSRHTPWPGSFVVDPSTGAALIFYENEETEPTSSFSFHCVGTSIATWSSPDVQAIRPEVRPELSDPTVLFPEGEPTMGAGALIDGDLLYAYSCPGGKLSSPCVVGRAPVAKALERGAWTFYAGSDWVADWNDAEEIFDGAPLMSVHRNPYLKKFVAFYMVPLGSEMAMRTAPSPEGPWSSQQVIGEAKEALDGNWDYGLAAHPELARDGGRVEYLSYYQPGTFLNGIIHLIEVTYP